jgi:hypothetical protein
MIDTYGQCTNEVAEELEYLGGILSPQEIDVVCSYYVNKSDCYSNSEY